MQPFRIKVTTYIGAHEMPTSGRFGAIKNQHYPVTDFSPLIVQSFSISVSGIFMSFGI